MFKCLICGTQFDEPSTYTEKQWHSEVDATETGYKRCCPICASEEFEELHKCRICGEWTMNDDYCTDCCKMVDDVIRWFIKFVYERCGDEFVNAVDDALDGTSVREWLLASITELADT